MVLILKEYIKKNKKVNVTFCKYFCVVRLAPLKIKDFRAGIISYLFTIGPREILHINDRVDMHFSERQEETLQN